jgi:F0F1-type ATP synthase assembly protein I
MPHGKRGKYGAAAEALTLAFVFPAAIAAGYFLGRWLDTTFNTSPWMTGIFTLLGISAAFVHLFRMGTPNDGSGDRKQ